MKINLDAYYETESVDSALPLSNKSLAIRKAYLDAQDRFCTAVQNYALENVEFNRIYSRLDVLEDDEDFSSSVRCNMNPGEAYANQYAEWLDLTAKRRLMIRQNADLYALLLDAQDTQAAWFVEFQMWRSGALT